MIIVFKTIDNFASQAKMYTKIFKNTNNSKTQHYIYYNIVNGTKPLYLKRNTLPELRIEPTFLALRPGILSIELLVKPQIQRNGESERG